MQQWIGPVLAAALTAGVSVLVGKGGAEDRLLKRAARSLDLAERQLPRSVRARLRASAGDDVSRALRLRLTGHAFQYVLWSAVGSTTVAVLIPSWMQTDQVKASVWQSTFWVVLWLLYVVMSLLLIAAVGRMVAQRSRVARGD